MPEINDTPDDFTLPDIRKNRVSLSDFRGKKVVLAFYPGAFTGVCDTEMCRLRDSLGEFEEVNAQVLGVSVDSPWANAGFARMHDLSFPLLSDYKAAVIRAWGHAIDGFGGLEGYTASNRAVYVLDENGVVTWKWVAPNPGVEPPYDEVKAAVS